MKHLLTVILSILALVAVVTGCGGAHRYDARLVRADSLMRPDPDSALAIVQAKSSVAFIAQAMGVSWGAMAGAFLAPFLYGLYWKRTTKYGCWASMVFSTVFMIIDMLGNLKIINVNLGLLQSPINAGAFCMIAGLVLVPLVSLVSKAPSKDKVDSIFACYERKVLVSAKDSIEVSEEA